MNNKKWREVRSERLASPTAQAAYWQSARAYRIGAEVRRLREEQGLSQRELGEKMGGAPQSVVARLEAGGVEPTLATLDRVAAALGVELDIHFGQTA